jgi:hypothetical protein
MNLSRSDADLFFKLMWAVQCHVNRRLNLLPDVKSAEDYRHIPAEEKVKVRAALYENIDDTLDRFIAENPSGLSDGELRIVQGWQRHVAGDFYVLRLLKRHAIFVSARGPSKVYGVLGLYDNLEEVLYAQPLPVLVKAVLLPFKGSIIYDGLLETYSITFGSGIRGDLNEVYQRAKQTGKIIESLEPGQEGSREPRPNKPARDWRPVLDGIVETTEKLRQADTIVQNRAFNVLKASARLAHAAAHDPDHLQELYQLGRRVQNALRQLETALNREEWA